MGFVSVLLYELFVLLAGGWGGQPGFGAVRIPLFLPLLLCIISCVMYFQMHYRIRSIKLYYWSLHHVTRLINVLWSVQPGGGMPQGYPGVPAPGQQPMPAYPGVPNPSMPGYGGGVPTGPTPPAGPAVNVRDCQLHQPLGAFVWFRLSWSQQTWNYNISSSRIALMCIVKMKPYPVIQEQTVKEMHRSDSEETLTLINESTQLTTIILL